MDLFSIAKIAAPIAGYLANIAVKKGFQFINKTDIQKAFDDDKISLFLDNWYNSRFADRQQAQRWKESLQRALGENDRTVCSKLWKMTTRCQTLHNRLSMFRQMTFCRK
ncbi:MAG: hypothetical protein SWX82_18660 [Cyanobacteriota bacterium]|nr:hypothetical protein [Cyanobacteriota bacterium]